MADKHEGLCPQSVRFRPLRKLSRSPWRRPQLAKLTMQFWAKISWILLMILMAWNQLESWKFPTKSDHAVFSPGSNCWEGGRGANGGPNLSGHHQGGGYPFGPYTWGGMWWNVARSCFAQLIFFPCVLKFCCFWSLRLLQLHLSKPWVHEFTSFISGAPRTNCAAGTPVALVTIEWEISDKWPNWISALSLDIW